MFDKTKINIYIFDEVILVQNQNGKQKRFPRCGITDVEMFVIEMAKKGQLDDLV